MTNTIHIIAGPTASGKSARALELAHEQNGVIINCDSMQIYDAMPILTAQPSKEDKKQAPHKLYGHLHPALSISAGAWTRLATPLIKETLQNGQTPIICGGTGFYIQALTGGLSPIPEIPPEIRQQAIALMHELGSPAFCTQLEKRDPLIKGRFHENHTARLMRAWEVFEATGKSLAYWQDQPKTPPPAHWTFETEIIMPDRETLYARCDRRFAWMLENGALEEVENFTQRLEIENISEDALITKALGFKELRAYLAGTLSREKAVTQSQTATRQYAKRQMTWLRNQL